MGMSIGPRSCRPGIQRGVVHQPVDAPEVLLDLFGHRQGRGLVGDVDRDRQRPVNRVGQLLGQRLDGIRIEVGEGDRGARLSDRSPRTPGRCPAQPR